MSNDTPPELLDEQWFLISASDAQRVRQLLSFVSDHRVDRSQPVEARSLAGYTADALRRFNAGLLETDFAPPAHA